MHKALLTSLKGGTKGKGELTYESKKLIIN